MTTDDKDRYCDSNLEVINDKIRQRELQVGEMLNNLQQNNEMTVNNDRQTLKRQLTSSSYFGDNNPSEENNDRFTLVNKHHKHKQRRVGAYNDEDENNDEDISIIDQNASVTAKANVMNGRTFLNSKNKTSNSDNKNVNPYVQPPHHTCQRRAQEDKNKNKSEDMSNGENRNVEKMTGMKQNNISEEMNKNNNKKSKNDMHIDMPISQHALLYAVENHLPPIRISCQPKINQNQQGKEIVKEFFNYIEKGFRNINKFYQYLLGFDYWYIDKNGDLVCYTKHTKLFVHLSETQNYPLLLGNINITPSRPRHLPSQHSVVLKFVPKYITQDDIESEIKTSIKSIFNVEEMKGSMNEKSRHVRLELSSKNEYDMILKNGGVTIDGHLIEVNEFLSLPRLLICSKCNDPGHIRRNCKFQYDACRRCGKDRTIGDDKECIICCHRCNENHLSTDYKCPYLVDYRRSLYLN